MLTCGLLSLHGSHVLMVSRATQGAQVWELPSIQVDLYESPLSIARQALAPTINKTIVQRPKSRDKPNGLIIAEPNSKPRPAPPRLDQRLWVWSFDGRNVTFQELPDYIVASSIVKDVQYSRPVGRSKALKKVQQPTKLPCYWVDLTKYAPQPDKLGQRVLTAAKRLGILLPDLIAAAD